MGYRKGRRGIRALYGKKGRRLPKVFVSRGGKRV